MEEYSISQLTPPALSDIINSLGGGMIQAIILGAEVIDSDGSRRNLFIWDNESSITIQLGLRDLLSMGLDLRAEYALSALDQELDGLEEDE